MVLAYDLEGSGTPVVLLHSGICDRRMWQPQWAPLLAAGFRVLRPDFGGYGDSPLPTEASNDASDVLDVLDAAGIDQAIVVGSSFGGRVGQEFAARWPDRVRALVLNCPAIRRDLLAPTGDVTAFGSREDELIEAGDLTGATELNVATFLGPAADAETRELVVTMQRHAFDIQVGAPEVDPITVGYDLAGITAPTLVISGDLDLGYFRNAAGVIAAAIPGARLVTLDWAGHLPSLEDPTRYNPVLLDFLADHA